MDLDYLRREVGSDLAKGLVEIYERKPVDPITYLGEYLVNVGEAKAVGLFALYESLRSSNHDNNPIQNITAKEDVLSAKSPSSDIVSSVVANADICRDNQVQQVETGSIGLDIPQSQQETTQPILTVQEEEGEQVGKEQAQ